MEPAALLRRYASAAESISLLFYPHAEVVLHDLATGQVAGIWNAFSGRRIGDPSLLEDELRDLTDGQIWGPYEKTGVHGEKLKTISAVLLDRRNGAKPAGLLCINLDVSRLDETARLLVAFVSSRQPQPPLLFSGDWREQMQTTLHGWLTTNGLALSALGRAERLALVSHLDSKGLFATRHGAHHAASLIGISRSSLYNLLRTARAAARPPRKAAP